MGDALLLFNISRPQRLTELSNVTQMASRTLAGNSRRSGRGGGFRARFSQVRECGKDVFGYGEASVTRAMHRTPAPLAGRRVETEKTRADAPPRGAPRPARARPVSATVLAASRPGPAHNRFLRLAGATLAAARKRRVSAAPGTGWPRNRCNWCGRSAGRAAP